MIPYRATGGFKLVLGIARFVDDLAGKTGGRTYFELTGTRLFIPERFIELANKADEIHFSTKGINWETWGRWYKNDGSIRHDTGSVQGTITNWELMRVLSDPALRSKTTFHE
jgi:hypothetical protein